MKARHSSATPAKVLLNHPIGLEIQQHQEMLKMKIAPDELLKTKGQKSDPDESMKTKDLENSQTKTSKSLEMNRLEGLSVVSCSWAVARGQLPVVRRPRRVGGG